MQPLYYDKRRYPRIGEPEAAVIAVDATGHGRVLEFTSGGYIEYLSHLNAGLAVVLEDDEHVTGIRVWSGCPRLLPPHEVDLSEGSTRQMTLGEACRLAEGRSVLDQEGRVRDVPTPQAPTGEAWRATMNQDGGPVEVMVRGLENSVECPQVEDAIEFLQRYPGARAACAIFMGARQLGGAGFPAGGLRFVPWKPRRVQ